MPQCTPSQHNKNHKKNKENIMISEPGITLGTAAAGSFEAG
jgi:hypothetical protein